ncbi:MAG: hypothetical protein KDC67_08085 [Ignavibacteriae bacterium]|nr:hypothetical protein [Ignavibacteriota bacterium]MCB0749048.1 hypothetical protein [Ignavibacteriota bacterium]
MAVLGKIIKVKNERINLRSGVVVGDVIIERDFVQLRTYNSRDSDRKEGAKQNIQFNKEKAREFRDVLNEFLGE